MSIKAIQWVKDDAPTENPTEMCILYALAERANDDGTGSWPSYATLADESRCSRRTVMRHISNLEGRGLIVRGNQAMVAHYPADRRPVVWNINMAMSRHREVSDCHPANGVSDCPPAPNGVTPVTERGDTCDTSGVTPVALRGDNGVTQTIHNHPSTTQNHKDMHATADAVTASSPEPATLPATIEPEAPAEQPEEKPIKGKRFQYPDEFENFWSVYPVRQAKRKAYEAWREALKRADAETIIAGAQRYADDPNRSSSHTKWPQGWLNADRWEDDPLPPRHESMPAGGGQQYTPSPAAKTNPDAWHGGQSFDRDPMLDALLNNRAIPATGQQFNTGQQFPQFGAPHSHQLNTGYNQ